MGLGGWDYPANTRGYNIGAMIQLVYNNWAFRYANTAMPTEANGPDLQWKGSKAMGQVFEVEKDNLFYKNDTHFSTLHAGIFWNMAHMGSYAEALAAGGVPDVTQSRQYGRSKWGYYAALDNTIGSFHPFIKTSWNDGNNESWAFTEIDASTALGFQLDGKAWHRKDDKLGLAYVQNNISSLHRQYLEKGGYGFLIGDGRLTYGPEQITELYYNMALWHHVYISPDYQFVINPAYNKDRGPVHIVSVRLHAEL
jgi:high affinity Mn2+ porin